MTLATAIIDRLVARMERAAGAAGERAVQAVRDQLAAAGVDVGRLDAAIRTAAVSEARDSLAARNERRRARTALGEDLRRLGSGKGAPPAINAPTRERVRHNGGAPIVEATDERGDPLSGPRYRWQWSLDRMAVSLSAQEYTAAERLRRAWAERQNTPGAVDWDRSGARAPGSRLPIRDEQLEAGAEVQFIGRRLPLVVRPIIANFVLEVPPRGEEHCLDAVEWGRRYGTVRDAATARGVTLGALRLTVATLAEAYDAWDRMRGEQRREQKRRRVAGEQGR